jgi:hypothetical protein
MVRRLLDLNHPFFRPLWRRVLVVAVCLAWAAFEFTTGSPFWGVLFGGIGLVCAWAFFLAWDPDQGSDPR